MDIKYCIEQVEMFNEIAGNLNNVTHDNLVAQAKVVLEEAKELYEAVLSGDCNEILKEAADCLVVNTGFALLLKEQGYDIKGAWNAVNINNLSKFPVDEKIACDSVDILADQGVFCKIEANDHYQVFVIKNEAGKVMKPINYKKCSVAPYTPKGILPKVKLPEQGEID